MGGKARPGLESLLAALLAAVFAALPAHADHYAGPPSSSTAYWAVPAYADIAERGSATAKGVVFWSHGVSGRNVQYKAHPHELMRHMAEQGWDVIKVQRNNLFENGWEVSGELHADDLLKRIGEAKAKGYKHIIAAGQSFGGAISLEAGAKTNDLLAVLAFAPGHGSDARQASVNRRYDMLTDMLIDVVKKQQRARVVLSAAAGDDLHPHEVRGPRIRAALAALNVPFIHFDESMPIRGHGAAGTAQFFAWFGRCVADFADPAKTPPAGETKCPPPDPIPLFLISDKLKVEPPPAGLRPELAKLSGAWFGKFDDKLEVCIVVEKTTGQSVNFVYALGAGPNRDKSMYSTRRVATVDGQKFISAEKDKVEIQFELAKDGGALEFLVISRNRENRFKAKLEPNCPP